MKLQEIVLDVIGVIAIGLSLWAYFFAGFDFKECTLIGVGGLSLFVLKGSSIRKLIEKITNKLIEKIINKLFG